MEFNMPKEQASIIKVIGVGGGGSNAVNHMFKQGIKGVDFIVCNTDNQALDLSPVPLKIQLGHTLTEGRGAGAKPEVGRNSAIENLDEIKEYLGQNTKMIFITAGMGGGTGTGAAPVIAQAAREMGILTVGIVTIPFTFEGKRRRSQAEEGINEMREAVDTLLVICNDRLREMYGNLSLNHAFAQADEVLSTAAKGIAEIITVTGVMNVDFEDVRTVMTKSGVAIMGSATAQGENRAMEAVEKALSSPLLNDNDIKGAQYVLLNITYGNDEVKFDEIGEITDYIQEASGGVADVIWGHGLDESLGDQVGVTLIATGFNSNPDTGFESDRLPEKKIISLEADLPTTLTNPINNVEDNEKEERNEQENLQTPQLFEQEDEQDDFEPFIKGKEHSENDLQSEKDNLDVVNNAEDRTIEFEINAPISEDIAENNADIEGDDFEPFVIRTEKEVNEPTFDTLDKNLDPKEETPDMKPREIYKEESDINPQLAYDRMRKFKDMSMKMKGSDGMANLENEPAYRRRNVTLDDVPHSSESSVSRFSLSEEEDENGDKKTGLRDNNSFLHDNVD